MKTCTKCGVEYPLSEFHNHKGQRDGLSLWCKSCVRIQGKKFRDTPAGKYSQLKGRFNFYHKKNLDISKEDFVEWYENAPKVCVYCDIKEEDLSVWTDNFNSHTLKMTVDCADNIRGYTKGNLVFACERCNATKGNLLSFDEMRDVAQRYIKPKWTNFECRRSAPTAKKVID